MVPTVTCRPQTLVPHLSADPAVAAVLAHLRWMGAVSLAVFHQILHPLTHLVVSYLESEPCGPKKIMNGFGVAIPHRQMGNIDHKICFGLPNVIL